MTDPFLQDRLVLTNTLTKRKEPFRPTDPGRVTMYVCGPTVWSFAHIGNARAAIAFDLLFRILRAAYGEEAVVYVRNITDVDDKIINAANATGETIPALVERYAAIYQADMAALGALAPTEQPRATDYIGQMVALIESLERKGAAYPAPNGMFFSVGADPDYGRLSGRDPTELAAVARLENQDPGKRAAADFSLWKAAKAGEPAWESPFGAGRPGWHIECSAMIRATLGDTIDIHGGGADLIFPHHENEIAQSETASGAPLARFWLHNGFLTMESEKMSKSLGNVTLVHDLLERWNGEVLRWALLSGQYRQPLDWSQSLLEQSKAALDRLYGALDRLADVEADEDAIAPEAFRAALADDLNTPQAFAELFALAARANKAEKPAAQARAKGELLAAGALVGMLGQDPAAWFGRSGGGEAEIEAMVAARVAARTSKDWAEADRLRAALDKLGVVVMDGPEGSTWRRIGPKT